MEIIPPHVLLGAYAQGVFPMDDDGEIQWFSPIMRGIIPVNEDFHVPHGLKRALRKKPYKIQIDTAFAETIQACSEREETWISPTIMKSYLRLHQLGHAHSFEAWDDEGLQGGLYGVSLGKAFFGESMFSRKADASKIALVHLVEWMRKREMTLLDTQWMTKHLRQFGGYQVPRKQYLSLLQRTLKD